jgi:hypothetical protein
LEEVAVYDKPWETLPDSTAGQTWTAYGYILLKRIRSDGTMRRIRCYFLREDSNGVQRPMTESRLTTGLMNVLGSGYVRFSGAERALDTTEEEVRIFTGATTWR